MPGLGIHLLKIHHSQSLIVYVIVVDPPACCKLWIYWVDMPNIHKYIMIRFAFIVKTLHRFLRLSCILSCVYRILSCVLPILSYSILCASYLVMSIFNMQVLCFWHREPFLRPVWQIIYLKPSMHVHLSWLFTSTYVSPTHWLLERTVRIFC